MTTPVVLPLDEGVLGPGTLKIGETGTELDASCLVNNCAIENSTDTADSTTKLCGSVRKGTATTTFTLTGNVDTDIGNEAGLFALSWNSAGEEVPFEFTPNTDIGTSASGTLVLSPLRFGADEAKADLTSDFEWEIVGKPTLSFDGAPVGPATGATAGTPGTWTPAGATAPADAAAATSSGVVASPATAWTTGQWVQGTTAGAAGEMCWDGTNWVGGKAP